MLANYVLYGGILVKFFKTRYSNKLGVHLIYFHCVHCCSSFYPYSYIINIAVSLGARSILYCATDLEVLKYAKILREKGSPLCAYYSSDCKPMVNFRKPEHVRYMAPRVWEKTLEAVGLKPSL